MINSVGVTRSINFGNGDNERQSRKNKASSIWKNGNDTTRVDIEAREAYIAQKRAKSAGHIKYKGKSEPESKDEVVKKVEPKKTETPKPPTEEVKAEKKTHPYRAVSDKNKERLNSLNEGMHGGNGFITRLRNVAASIFGRAEKLPEGKKKAGLEGWGHRLSEDAQEAERTSAQLASRIEETILGQNEHPEPKSEEMNRRVMDLFAGKTAKELDENVAEYNKQFKAQFKAMSEGQRKGMEEYLAKNIKEANGVSMEAALKIARDIMKIK